MYEEYLKQSEEYTYGICIWLNITVINMVLNTHRYQAFKFHKFLTIINIHTKFSKKQLLLL